LYDRPIEIYSYSIEPLKTFHENGNFNRFGKRSETADKNSINKIAITYHGSSHYNSLVTFDQSLFNKNLLKTKPGILEKNTFEKLKKLKADLHATSQKAEAGREKTNIPPTAYTDNNMIKDCHSKLLQKNFFNFDYIKFNKKLLVKADNTNKNIGNSREDFMNKSKNL
jgi:hypothetical protein